MKRVVNDNELKEKMIEAVNMLCNPVKNTLGPKGLNVIIDHSDFSPFVTNDGVSIAQNIESEDEVINTILTLAKEATIKTNELVGDGTTTTLVLLQSIFTESLKLIEQGINPMVIKKNIIEISKEIVTMIEKKSKKPSNKELLNIAITSANDYEIGLMVYKAFKKVKDKRFINIKEGDKTKLNILKGYIIDTLIASPYFLNSKEIIFNNPNILLSDSLMYDIESISIILNYIYDNNKELVIISQDYDDNFVNEILSLVINDNYKIILLKIPEYGNKQIEILRDIECICNGKINHDRYYLESLGTVNSIKINKEKIIFNFENSHCIDNRINEIKKDLKEEKEDYEIDFCKRRIAMLKNKTAEIIVGGETSTIIHEKIMRFEDSLCAISSSFNGVLPGSGVVFYEISNNLKEDKFYNIFKLSLKEPLRCILNNSGLSLNIIKELEKDNFKKIYNVNIDEYEDISNTLVLDSKEVLINSIVNASMVSSTLLSTSNLVINEDKPLNNIDYNL